jgi:superfamily I DNA and/or RNA helicase
VSITRSKALLIVVGNPKLLWLDHYWKALIGECMKNGGFCKVLLTNKFLPKYEIL